MPTFRRFLSRRRLLGSLAVTALLFGLLMLHPYPRQSLFGPTIGGRPLCAWESDLRYCAYWDENQKTTVGKVERWSGLKTEDSKWLHFPEQLLLAKSEDADPVISSYARRRIVWGRSMDRAIVPILHAALQDKDTETRHRAAVAIWRFEKDRSVIAMFQAEIDKGSAMEQRVAALWLSRMYEDAPDAELLRVLLLLARHPDPGVRSWIMTGMAHAKENGVPVLINGLTDRSKEVRASAARSLQAMGPHATDAVPALETRLADGDNVVRVAAKDALAAIEPERVKNQAKGK